MNRVKEILPYALIAFTFGLFTVGLILLAGDMEEGTPLWKFVLVKVSAVPLLSVSYKLMRYIDKNGLVPKRLKKITEIKDLYDYEN